MPMTGIEICISVQITIRTSKWLFEVSLREKREVGSSVALLFMIMTPVAFPCSSYAKRALANTTLCDCCVKEQWVALSLRTTSPIWSVTSIFRSEHASKGITLTTGLVISTGHESIVRRTMCSVVQSE